jgi:hypothetical protein
MLTEISWTIKSISDSYQFIKSISDFLLLHQYLIIDPRIYIYNVVYFPLNRSYNVIFIKAPMKRLY